MLSDTEDVAQTRPWETTENTTNASLTHKLKKQMKNNEWRAH